MFTISSEELDATLTREDNAVTLLKREKETLLDDHIEIEKNHGRPKGAIQIPDVIRDAAAIEARVSGDLRGVSEAYGIGYSTVAQNSTGIIGGNKHADSSKALRDRLRNQLTPVRDKALDKLMKSLDCITEEKLEKSKPGELASVSAQMARIIEKSIIPEPEAKGADQVLVIPATVIKQESHYQTVVLEAER